ncbi:MAG: CoA-disulfide reductase [Epulopiscium sp. Nuni2H_MBin003]|nr:MAG: CoA-disulfide reductase [Epulopiscium sp. Nuni2H_MBin003]
MKVIIIGGVAAGMSAASKIKRIDKNVEVIVYEKGEHISYGACGLPYFVGGFNDDYTKMIARSKEAFEAIGIEVKLKHEVLMIKEKDKKILVHNHITGDTNIESYDKLVISTGASVVVPPVKGVCRQEVYYLKTLEDGLKLQKVAQQPHIRNVIVIGAGYIGIEVVDAFLHLGKNVTCIEFGNHILAPFDSEISDVALDHLKQKGANIKLSEKVIEFTDAPVGCNVITDKTKYSADLVVMSVGVRPNTQFLENTKINVAGNGAIIVDRQMRTSIPDIYAAGDCALVYHKSMQEDVYLPLGTTANKCGRIVGENIMGAHKTFVGALGSAGIKVGDLELGRTGLKESDANRLKLNYKTVVVDSYDHPMYYPNPTIIKIKLIYEVGTKKILGAQAIGEKGVILRIDMFAIAIHNEMTTDDLGMTDLIYAPPFAGVWDAVHIACNIAK